MYAWHQHARFVPAPAAALAAAALVLTGCTGGGGSPSGASSAAGPAGADAVAAAVRPGNHSTVAADYRLPGLTIPRVRLPVEVAGHVVGPTDVEGALPLVVFLHGYTASCWRPSDGSSTTDWPCRKGFRPIPSWRGFDYLQQRLASQGYLTVSVHANGVNAMATEMDDDAGAEARAVLVQHHLDAWAAGDVPNLAAWPDVDLRNVMLVGHSRGGEGVDRTVAERPADAAWAVAGELLIAPTAFEPAPRSTVPVVAMTGYCDGDVGPGPGQRYVDRPADPRLLRSSVVVEGANHNFFNAEWVPGESTVPGGYDDSLGESGEPDPMCAPGAATRLSPGQQQDVALRVIGLAAASFLRDDPASADVLDGRVAVPVARDEVVHVSAIGRDRVTLRYGDDFRVTGSGAMDARPCNGVSETESPEDCGRFTGEGQSVHWPGAYRTMAAVEFAELRWRGPGAVRLALSSPLDLSGAAGLEARIALTPEGPPTGFEVAVADSGGHQTTVSSAGDIAAFPEGPLLPSRRWGFRMFAPLGEAGDADLTDIVSVTLTPTADSGHGWVIDVSAVPSQ